MKIFYDLDLQSQVVQGKAVNAKKPVLYYGTAPVWEVEITSGGEAADLSGVTGWRAAVDADFDRESRPVCRSLADRIDLRNAAGGIVRVQLLTLTAEFLAALNREKQRNGYFELQALTGDGYAEFIIQIPVILHAAVDPADAEIPDPVEVDPYVKQTEVEAMFARVLVYEYSSDGEESHGELRDGDLYFRIRHGSTGVPSDWQLIPYGPQGEPGEVPDLSGLENRISALESAVGNAAADMAAIIGGE